jgi:capsular exopolysaccharide synthesis family protein
MSKNFELMQQTGRGSAAAASPAPQRPLSVTPSNGHGNGNGNGHRNGAGLNLDDLAQEETQKLVQRVFLLQAGEPPRVVIFAGIDTGNGCSRVCARSAQVLAANIPGKVCLVDANLRSPSLPDYFGMTNHHGLTDALLQEGPIQNFIKPIGNGNLWLLSCGSLASDSTSLLHSERVKSRLAELRGEFDFILIDSPALSQYADAVSLGQLADGMIFVLEANSTRRESAVKVMENLRASNVQVLGAVLNKREYPIPDSVYHKL